MDEYKITLEEVNGYKETHPYINKKDIVRRLYEKAITRCDFTPGTEIDLAYIVDELGLDAETVYAMFEEIKEKGLIIKENGIYYVYDIYHTNLEEIIEARKVIENYAASMCAKHNKSVDMHKLKDLAVQYGEATRNWDYENFAQIDQQFHRLIVDSCGNELVIGMYDSLENSVQYAANRIEKFMESQNKNYNFSDLENQHMGIYNAISLGMPDMAFQASDRHLDTCLLVSIRGYAMMEEKNRRR